MSHRAKELEQARKARGRLRMIQHCEQVTRNVSRTASRRSRTIRTSRPSSGWRWFGTSRWPATALPLIS